MKTLNYLLILVFFACESKTKEDVKLYTPFSTSVIEVDILNNPTDTIFMVAYANTLIPRNKVESNDIVTNVKGKYYLTIEIDRPLKGGFKLGKKAFDIIILPNDTTHIQVDFDDHTANIQFTGKYKMINDYFTDKQKNLGYTDPRLEFSKHIRSKSTYALAKRKIDSVTNIATHFFEDYKTDHDLPAWFLDLEFSEILYSGASFKTSIPFTNRTFNYFDDNLPNQYFNFLEETEVDNSSAIFSPAYLRFLDSYFIRNLPTEYDKYSGFLRSSEVRKYTLNLSKKELSGVAKDVYQKYNFGYLLRFYSDSLEIDSLAKEFQINDYTNLLRITGSKSKGGLSPLNLNPTDTIPEFYVTSVLDSLISIRDFSNNIVYINFWATWCGPCIKNIPALNEMITEFVDDDKVAFLNICLDSEKEKWSIAISKHNLQGINLLAVGNWNSRLKSYFNIKGIPHYSILREDNILEENFANKAPLVKERIIEVLKTANAEK
ncbi:TlpA disulfide reductase family protein [Reichenbachiella sp. MALMAid0571]|uniref:TlpA family protein disulfide reductase n=1 Tax=Reichenbachiella sp. MALMAid0571 TaxID=3143939 RepID=UPI0032DF4C45